MQEYWIFFAIATAICIGFYGFAQKIKAEIPYQSDNGFVAYSYITMWIVWILGSLIFGTQLDLTNTDIFLYALWITLCYIVIVKTRLISLRYLSSSSYFINYRIASSLWLMFVGIIFFAETISLGEILWIFLWFVVFYLLIEKKSASESISDMKKWFLYLLIGSIAVTWVQAVAKDFTTLRYKTLINDSFFYFHDSCFELQHHWITMRWYDEILLLCIKLFPTHYLFQSYFQ